jgi:glycosyltransferase involved in cell wall biosynthesis
MQPASSKSPPWSVSVGMAVYNGQPFLLSAIESVLQQSYADFELIISDNASTDESTRAICEAIAMRDRRVRYIRQPTNVGAAANFRFVLDEACGDYFMWAAHDDLRDSSCLARLVEALSRNSRAVLASSAFDNLDYDGRVLHHDSPDWRGVFSGPKVKQLARFISLDEIESQKANHIYGLIRRRALLDAVVAVSTVDAYSGNDICTLLELLGQGEFEIVPEALFHYRTRPPVPQRRDVAEAEERRLLPYLWQRLAGRSTGHGGNAVKYLRRINEYCGGLRAVVRRQVCLGWTERLYLHALIWMRQITLPVRTIIRSARHEL